MGGAEHRSAGQFDENGTSPKTAGDPASSVAGRRLADDVRYGFACHKYAPNDSRFTTEYAWKHCVNMHVGETYEVHWPHSSLGACGTPNQYQYPFYDGVFCMASADRTLPTMLVCRHKSSLSLTTRITSTPTSSAA